MADEIVWKIGGEAGYGILSTGRMFTELMKELGYYVFSITEYPSLIRGGHNTFTVRASKQY
jgi:2-oxoglutarate ferredoxin oxidoreductase subunit alpha